jgi:hypothetical protein
MKAAPARVNPAFDKLAAARRGSHVAHMTGKDKEREERLAAALRENLRRRKAQSRKLDGGEKKKTTEA